MSCSESLEGINFLSLLGFGSHTCDRYEYTHKCLNGFPRELKETPQRAQLRRREHAGIPDGQLGFKRPGQAEGKASIHSLTPPGGKTRTAERAGRAQGQGVHWTTASHSNDSTKPDETRKTRQTSKATRTKPRLQPYRKPTSLGSTDKAGSSGRARDPRD